MGLRENRYRFNMDFLDSANAELQLQRLWYMHEDNDKKKKGQTLSCDQNPPPTTVF